MNTLLAYGITTVLMIIIWLPTWHIFGGLHITLILSAAALEGLCQYWQVYSTGTGSLIAEE